MHYEIKSKEIKKDINVVLFYKNYKYSIILIHIRLHYLMKEITNSSPLLQHLIV